MARTNMWRDKNLIRRGEITIKVILYAGKFGLKLDINEV